MPCYMQSPLRESRTSGDHRVIQLKKLCAEQNQVVILLDRPLSRAMTRRSNYFYFPTFNAATTRLLPLAGREAVFLYLLPLPLGGMRLCDS